MTTTKNNAKVCGGCDQPIHAQPCAALTADGRCNGIIWTYFGSTYRGEGFIKQRSQRHHRCKNRATHGHHCARHCACKDYGCCD